MNSNRKCIQLLFIYVSVNNYLQGSPLFGRVFAAWLRRTLYYYYISYFIYYMLYITIISLYYIHIYIYIVYHYYYCYCYCYYYHYSYYYCYYLYVFAAWLRRTQRAHARPPEEDQNDKSDHLKTCILIDLFIAQTCGRMGPVSSEGLG